MKNVQIILINNKIIWSVVTPLVPIYGLKNVKHLGSPRSRLKW